MSSSGDVNNKFQNQISPQTMEQERKISDVCTPQIFRTSFARSTATKNGAGLTFSKKGDREY